MPKAKRLSVDVQLQCPFTMTLCWPSGLIEAMPRLDGHCHRWVLDGLEEIRVLGLPALRTRNKHLLQTVSDILRVVSEEENHSLIPHSDIDYGKNM